MRSLIAVVTLSTRRQLSDQFAFRLEHTDNGVNAISLRGTTWQRLAWSCTAEPCLAYVDEPGVRRS